jgi:hypothetical protein
MAIQVHGQGGVVADSDGTGFRALRITRRPVEYGALGAYSYAHLSGTMAAGLAANREIFHALWMSTKTHAVVTFVNLDLWILNTAFTAGFGCVRLMQSTFITGISLTEGLAATVTGDNSKLRTTMSPCGSMILNGSVTAQLAIWISGQQLEHIIGIVTMTLPAVTTYAPVLQNAKLLERAMHPVVLCARMHGVPFNSIQEGACEGLLLSAAVPATGTWGFGTAMHWTEVAEY